MSNTNNTAAAEPFAIPAHRWDYLTARIAKLARKQARLLKRGPVDDATPISVRQVGIEYRPGNCVSCGESKERHPVCPLGYVAGPDRVYYLAEVTGAAPKLAGFEFLATLQHDDAGTILRTVPTATIADGELNRFRTVKPHCEHCETRRYRKDSFVVRETATGIVKQVGRNCLGAYLGGQSPEGVASLATMLADIRAGLDDELGDYYGGGHELALGLPEFMIAVAMMVRLHGWVSKSAAANDPTERLHSTVGAVWNLMFPVDADDRAAARAFRAEMTDADRDTAARAFQMFGDFVNSGSTLNDYLWNLRVSLGSPLVTSRKAGIAGSLIGWYERETGRQAERIAADAVAKAARESSQHVGEVKQRLDLTLTVTRIVTSCGDYGTSYGHFFADATGNVFVWWTGSTRLEIGTTYTGKCTVKKHDEYKDIKQTALTRCSLAPVAQAPTDA
jgi:hypothetical protein